MLDLGCWPGSWLDLAAERVGAKGRVVGVDRAALDPPPAAENATALVGDLEDPGLGARLREALGGPADVLLSDAAPKLTGIRDADRAQEERLLEAVERLAGEVLRPGGDLVVKLLDGPEAQQVARRLAKGCERSRTGRPKATRKGSSESYLVGHGWKATPAGSPG